MLGKGEETIDQDFNRYLFRGVQPVSICATFSRPLLTRLLDSCAMSTPWSQVSSHNPQDIARTCTVPCMRGGHLSRDAAQHDSSCPMKETK